MNQYIEGIQYQLVSTFPDGSQVWEMIIEPNQNITASVNATESDDQGFDAANINRIGIERVSNSLSTQRFNDRISVEYA